MGTAGGHRAATVPYPPIGIRGLVDLVLEVEKRLGRTGAAVIVVEAPSASAPGQGDDGGGQIGVAGTGTVPSGLRHLEELRLVERREKTPHLLAIDPAAPDAFPP
jgi:hypothetical protein